jgi:sigma-B regulation protein RsbU (phosphoserine phosphatase)
MKRKNRSQSPAAVAAPESGPRTVATLSDAQEIIAHQAHTIDRLHFLVEASKVLNSTLELPELLGIILKMASQNTGADRGSLFLVDREQKQIWSLLAQGLDHKEIRLPMGKGIAGAVAESGEVVNLADAYDDPRFDRSFDQKLGYRTRSLLCLPIKERDDKIVGVLQLLNKRDGNFNQEDVEFLQGLSVHFAIALENARLHRESLERQRMERELQLARSIQQSLLPEAAPQLPGFDVAVRHQSSLEVGGDYYEFLLLNPQTLLFVVADVEGKGVASAMIMSNLQATLRAVVQHVHSLEGVMFMLNESIIQSARSRKFMTMFTGLLDVAGRGLHYVNAGHVPPVVARATGEPALLKEGGIPVGLFSPARYERGFLQLELGDIILTCTDGIVESNNAAGDQYETSGILRVVQAKRDRSSQEIVDAIFGDVAEFSRQGTHYDDKVMMAIKVV